MSSKIVTIHQLWKRAQQAKIREEEQARITIDRDLPIYSYRKRILNTIEKNEITLINSPTGSGKTTQVPQFIYDNCASKDKIRIVVTQPRRIATIMNAKRVASERQCPVGDLVGYQIGMDKQVSENHKTKILYVTTGVLLEMLVTHDNAARFTHVILDEVHERSADMDLVMTLLKEYLYLNSSFKLILMSATMQVDFLRNYFTYGNEMDSKHIKPEVLEINVAPKYQKSILYLDDLDLRIASKIMPKPEINHKTMEIARSIILEKLSENLQNSTILVFLPGIYEIKQMQSYLKLEHRIDELCRIMILHSEIASHLQEQTFGQCEKSKIVLCTNIAESSITIPDVTCVIDFCLTKHIECNDKNSSIARLTLAWASRNNLEQRAGRTNRTCKGDVYRLTFKSMYNDFELNETPEMRRGSLESIVLKIKRNIHDKSPTYILDRAPSPPSIDKIVRSVLKLKELGGLHRHSTTGQFDSQDGDITMIGRVMQTLPIDVSLSKLIVLGYMFSVLDEAIIIAAGLSTRGIFLKHAEMTLETYEKQLQWANVSACDFTAILNAYTIWINRKQQGMFKNFSDEFNWCKSKNLSVRNLHEMLRLVQEIKDRLEVFQFEPIYGKVWTEYEKPLIIKIVAAGAFYPNYFISGKTDEFTELDIAKHVDGLNPERTIFFKTFNKSSRIPIIYEHFIKELMVDSGVARDVDKIRVTFSNSSASCFIEFLDKESPAKHSNVGLGQLSSEMPGSVPLPVYMAAQATKLRMKFNLRVMDEDNEQNFLRASDLYDESQLSQIKPNFMENPDLCVLPSSGEDVIDAVIVHVVNPQKFYVQRFVDDALLLIDEFFETKGELAVKPILNIKLLQQDELVIVKGKEKFIRAKVLKVNYTTAICLVLLVDYGVRADVELRNIFTLSYDNHKELFDVPERCFEARLSHLAPNFLKCPDGTWTEESIEVFKELVLEKRCNMKVYSCENEYAAVSIDGVGERLIANQFARHVDENFASKLNHLRRLRPGPVPAEIQFANRISTLKVNKFPPVPKEKCNQSLSLKGPTIPMTATLTDMFAEDKNESFITSSSSVNSVLCKSNNSYSGNLLIAADILKSRDKSVLHETSLMPDIPGFAVLMALIFAPQTEIKLSDDGMRYEFLRAGLGCNPNTGNPYFFAHDLMLPVDIDITLEDFSTINKLRYAMSKLVHDRVRADATDTVEYLSYVKEHILKILSRERSPISPMTFLKSKDWPIDNMPDQTIHVEDVLRGRGIFNVFNYKTPVPISDEMKTAIKAKLAKLKAEVDICCNTRPKSIESKTQSVHCWICDTNYDNYLTLKMHLDSDMHKQTLKLFRIN